MADAEAFEVVAARLEEWTRLDRLEARGTLRLALKQAGLEAKTVRAEELRVVISRVLPNELRARGIEDESSICDRLSTIIPADAPSPTDASPESVFERLSGDR